MLESSNIVERAEAYALQRGIKLQFLLGAGYDGTVFATDRPSAIKVLHWRPQYETERDVYVRLRQHQVQLVAGCHVPRLIEFDDPLWIVEMAIVSPPYVLDFAGVYLDRRPDFPPDVRRQWEREKRAQFGSDWKHVPRVVFAFERLGISLADLSPRNICLTGYHEPPFR